MDILKYFLSYRGLRFLPVAALLSVSLLSCNSDDDDLGEYTEWNSRNLEYVANIESERDADGELVYEKRVPAWAQTCAVYMRWHNDRSETENNLTPLDNSTVAVNYQVHDIDGTLVDSSDTYVTMPMRNVVGFWTALTNMHVGDTVTAVVPALSGYGTEYHGSLKPYSTLIFDIRLKSIVGYEIKH